VETARKQAEEAAVAKEQQAAATKVPSDQWAGRKKTVAVELRDPKINTLRHCVN
jgi:hypothetical protein